jgi:GT2 family glycosyltransferase
MAHTPSKALIFINWNTGALTVAAARSARATHKSPDSLRIIVVDNGSSDDSLDVLARDLSEAEVIALPENRGFAKAVNAALATVREDIAFVLNSDIEFRNDAIALLAEALRQHPDAALACPKLLRPDGSLQAAAVPEPRLFWELVNRSVPRHFMRISEVETCAVPGVVGPCMAVVMERISRIGYLDERFFFFLEETDWCKRINDAGMQVLYVPSAEVMHMQGESANRRPTRARVQFYSSRYRYFRKHGGLPAVAVLYLGMFFRLSVNIVLHSVLTVLTLGSSRHRDRVAVNGRLWLWHLLGCRPKWGFEP